MEQIEFTEDFISKIEDILKYKNEEKARKMQSKVIAAFQNDISKLDQGLSYNIRNINNRNFYSSSANYIDNLELLKCKLESYLAKLKSEKNKTISVKKNETTFNINNTNNNTNNNTIDMKFVFDEARKTIDENESLEDHQIEEIKDKITELETIFNSEDSKKDKWSKCREIHLWIANKGVFIATIIVPLIAKCLQNK